jgi:hypothetical protein
MGKGRGVETAKSERAGDCAMANRESTLREKAPRGKHARRQRLRLLRYG